MNTLHRACPPLFAVQCLVIICALSARCQPLHAQESNRTPIWERRPYAAAVQLYVDRPDRMGEAALARLARDVPRLLQARFGQSLRSEVREASQHALVANLSKLTLSEICRTTDEDLSQLLPTSRKDEKYFMVMLLVNRTAPIIVVWEWDAWVDSWSRPVVRPFLAQSLNANLSDALGYAFRAQSKVVRVTPDEVKLRIRASNLPYRLRGSQPMPKGATAEVFVDGQRQENSWLVVIDRNSQISSAQVHGQLSLAASDNPDFAALEVRSSHVRTRLEVSYGDSAPGQYLFVEYIPLGQKEATWKGRTDVRGSLLMPVPKSSGPQSRQPNSALGRLIVSWDGVRLHDQLLVANDSAVLPIQLRVSYGEMGDIGSLSDILTQMTLVEAEREILRERVESATKAKQAAVATKAKSESEPKIRARLNAIKQAIDRFEQGPLASSKNGILRNNWKIVTDRWKKLSANEIKTSEEK